jgi:hypothetical protein
VLFVLLEHLLDLLNRFQFTLQLIAAQEARPLVFGGIRANSR